MKIAKIKGENLRLDHRSNSMTPTLLAINTISISNKIKEGEEIIMMKMMSMVESNDTLYVLAHIRFLYLINTLNYVCS